MGFPAWHSSRAPHQPSWDHHVATAATDAVPCAEAPEEPCVCAPGQGAELELTPVLGTWWCVPLAVSWGTFLVPRCLLNLVTTDLWHLEADFLVAAPTCPVPSLGSHHGPPRLPATPQALSCPALPCPGSALYLPPGPWLCLWP